MKKVLMKPVKGWFKRGASNDQLMLKCGFCGKEAKKLDQCSVCGIRFCANDGSPEKKLCNNCIDKEKEVLEAEHEEEREKEHEGEEVETEREEDAEDEAEDKDEDLDDYRY